MNKKFGSSGELVKIIPDEFRSNKCRLDSLVWKWNKVLYRFSRIVKLHEKLTSREREYVFEYREKYQKIFSDGGCSYELTMGKNWDKKLIFEFEAFLDEIIETIDALPPLFSSKFPDVKRNSFHKFRNSLLQKHPKNEITLKVDNQWKTWIKKLKDFRDDETHHSLYYHRHKIRITNGFVDFIPPAIPAESIKTWDEAKIEDHLSEFNYRCNTDDWDDDREPDEAFWESFCEYFNTIEEFSEVTIERTWNLFNNLLG